MKNNIAIDCFKLVKGEGKSIGIYNFTKNFIENLALFKKYNIYIFGNKFNKNDFDIDGVIFIDIPIKFRNKFIYIAWELLFINIFIYKYNIKLTVYPRGYIPLFSISKTFNIIHDLIPIYYYDNYRNDISYFENLYIRKRLLSSIKRSDKTIAISNYTKEEILKYYPNKANSLSVIHNGYNKLDTISISGRKNKEYIVAVSSANLKHKNLINIIKVYILYHGRVENPMKLHLIGVDSLENINIFINEEIKGSIVLYDYISDKKYIEILQNAKIFLFLSLIEGFGFPPLEAMNLGTAVICSDKTSLKEVVGNGGILVNPHDINLITSKIIFISNDKKYRNQLILNGYENIKRFKWQDIIRQYACKIDNEM